MQLERQRAVLPMHLCLTLVLMHMCLTLAQLHRSSLRHWSRLRVQQEPEMQRLSRCCVW